jgi:hypothetical protein
MRSLDEILRLARELPAAERRKLVEELERLDEEPVDAVESGRAWAEWVDHGPQGPIDDDSAPWP